MKQLSLNISQESDVKVIASSAYQFRVELVKKVGKNDIKSLIDISQYLSEKFGDHASLTKTNIHKYFNKETIPFVARLKNEIIGYIIGVPLEHFKQESWAHFDVNLNRYNTIYTYAFVVKEKFRSKGGYGKTLKKIYINWAKKQGYTFVTGHVRQGISKKFSTSTEIVKIFPVWYNSKSPFEYYRRPLK
tara:strand:- start:313 stop:879 length:567 start_codon:yes stop_codon:yes gene_type:complete